MPDIQSNKTPSSYQFKNAVDALLRARQRLLEEDPDIVADERLLHDMLEGDDLSGDAMSTLHNVLRAARHAQAMEEQARAMAKKISDRAKRFEVRAATLRTAAFEAMSALGLSRVPLPDLTASIRRGGQPGVFIIDETALPAEFVRTKTEPDKAAIRAELLRGREVSGASLSNAAPFLTITTD